MKEYFDFFKDINRNQEFSTYLSLFEERLQLWLQAH